MFIESISFYYYCVFFYNLSNLFWVATYFLQYGNWNVLYIDFDLAFKFNKHSIS